ncbi:MULTISPECIES: 2,3-diaminopropionate biosynthesis protein SbnA [Streptomyces]|uniref:2,3-diaminopropionate biosynthesis protein SbnA n=1 Tax=Streptomyces TaxID=1883 RepID=UPI001C860654|nr:MULTISPECIES: 2,3-diaminopropionate biosynthesis protein SbnA [unclassified Streptomyces]MCX2922843.1 2,3-diaminopropionate biosynthesis protein SbnA [Streptomyces sp. NEAU-W12]
MPERSNSGILGTIGKTPLVKLERMFPEGQSEVFAKIERFNPGGSIKDRSGLNMIVEALRSGEITPGRSVVVESSSGNLAVGLAQICRYFGLRFICVVDAKTTEQNLAILKAYRAEVEVVDERDAATGEFLPVRLRRVRELLESVPHAYSPNQYANLRNPKAHQSTMHEIVEALDGHLDFLFCSVSTFGTLRGCADYIHRAGLPTTIVAVDADGSAIFDRPPARRLIPGHGASVRPALMDPGAADDVMHVSDLDCVVFCRRLVAREAILAGGSSGAVLAAVDRMLPRIPPGSVSALIFPDGGDRYLKTIYSDDWVREHFGEVSHLWKG